MVDLVLIHQIEIAVVHCPEDCVCYVPPDDLGYSLRNPLFDFDFSEAEDVLLSCFVLHVDIVVYLRFDGSFIGAGAFGGSYQRCKHISFLYVDCQLVLNERVTDVASQSLHSVGRVFEQLSLEDALDLCNEYVRVILGVDADFILVKAALRYICKDPGSFLCAYAEERAAIHGEI